MLPKIRAKKMVTGFFLPSKMKMIGCKESFVEFFVDFEQARRIVPSRFQVREFQNGKAVLLIMIQEWDKCILDGFLPIKKVNMAHIWLELVGPSEVGQALSGTEASLPTCYYYALPHQIDNEIAVFAFRLAGIDVQLVQRIEVTGRPGDHRCLRVIEQGNPAIGYSWEVFGNLWEHSKTLTGRRWFYRDYGRRIKRASEGLVVCRSTFFGDGNVRLFADRGSVIERLGFGRELPGALQFVTTECDCEIRVGRQPSN